MLTETYAAERERKKRLKIKNATSLLLAVAMLVALIRAAGGMKGVLLASVLLGMPQGAPALLAHAQPDEKAQPEPPQEQSSQQDSGSKLTDGTVAGEDKGSAEEKSGETPSQPEERADENANEQSGGNEELPAIAPGNAGTVVVKKYTASDGGIYIAHGSGIIKNCTRLSRERILEKLAVPFEAQPFEPDGDEPVVLIVHTHATESYEKYGDGRYDRSYTFRSTDTSENMVSVGAELLEALRENGVPAVQAAVLHDDPSYNGSYERSAETVKKYLKLYPSIQFVLDIHRDAIEPQKGRIIKAAADIDGRTAAQVMIISGCDDGTMNMPDYFSNLRFAAALQDKMEAMFPGLTRPVFFCYRKYNMDLSPGALLIEVGSHGNTLDEAKYSARLIGRALAALISPQKKTAGAASGNAATGGNVQVPVLFSEQARKRLDNGGEIGDGVV